MPVQRKIKVGKSVSATPIGAHLAGQAVSLLWTPVNFSLPSPTAPHPLDFMLQLLVNTGNAENTIYDVYQLGIGLGIPQERIDLASFQAIRDEDDYDAQIGWWGFFSSDEAMGGLDEGLGDAKKFIEEELCRPFGYFLVTGHDGLIKARRPKHPQKFHVSKANNNLSVNAPGGGQNYLAFLPVGIYTGQEMAAQVATTLNSVVASPNNNFSCSYDTATNKFTLSKATNTFDFVAVTDDGWTSLGFTNMVTGQTSRLADVAKGAWPFSDRLLDKNDAWDIQLLENRDDQITQVIFHYNYDFLLKEYTTQKSWIDAEAVNLGDTLGTRNCTIKSKGLIGDFSLIEKNPVSYVKEPVSGCTPLRVNPTVTGAIGDESWAHLYAKMLMDRYKWPPLKFKAKLRWRWHKLEVGDVVKFSYDIGGLFADRERNSDRLASRIFEVTQLNPNFAGGFVEATFLGHRYVSY